MKILIIDDEPDTVTFLSAWLQDQGYETCFATDGEQGMSAIVDEQPDLILLDIKMPHQTGVQLYRKLHSDEKYKDLPIIFITGMVDFHVFDDTCTALPEPAACITKPFDLKAMRIAIEKALGKSSI